MASRPEVLLQCLKSDLAVHNLDPEGVEAHTGSSILDAAGRSIRSSLLKKLRTGMTDATTAVALDKFLAVNQRCKEWTLPSSLDEKTSVILGTLRQYLYNFWHEGGLPLLDHPYDMLSKASVGPGANRRARAGSFYAKLFASPLTCSRIGLYNWYERYIGNFPRWHEAENFRRSAYGGAHVVPSNRLSFVSKNDKESRTICTEPTLNTMFQLGFGHVLEQRLLRLFGISLSDQQFKNRALARLGSITDGLSTIDLSSASDSISLAMLREFLPRSFMEMLEFSRCATSEVPNMGTLELNMVSTMGNGFTFPLQTVLFSCVVASCMSVKGIPWQRPSNFLTQDGWKTKRMVGAGSDESWGVFGDDIICPRSVTEDVISTLNILGFSVNRDKTFFEGPFRESCGHDFFEGVMIRGVYVKTLDTPQDCAAVLNQLTRFCTRTPLLLLQTMQQIRDWYPDLPLVPRYEDMSAGFHVTLEYAQENSLLKWNKRKSGFNYHYFAPRRRFYRVLEDRVSSPRGCKPLIFNPEGLYVSQLQGSIKESKIGIRDETVKYSLKRRTTSSWDDVSYGRVSTSNDWGLDWGRFNSVIAMLQ
jgi:hypothetical protein